MLDDFTDSFKKEIKRRYSSRTKQSFWFIKPYIINTFNEHNNIAGYSDSLEREVKKKAVK